MANILLAVQTFDKAGATPTYQGSLLTTDTYQVPNDGDTWVHFKKSGAGVCTVTFKTPREVGGLAVAEWTPTAVPATTGDKLFCGFDPDLFNVAGAGYLEFTLSDIAGLTVACFRKVK